MKRLLLLTALWLTIGLGFAALLQACGVSMLEWYFTDTMVQIVAFMAESRRIFAEGFGMWSWNAMLGDNAFGLYAYYSLCNPLSWIVMAFPPGYVLVGMIVALYIKTLLTAVFARLYLRRLGFDDTRANAGALLYTLTSYLIVSLIYYIFVEPVMMFALLLWAIEGVLQRRRYAYTILTAVTAATIFVNYYFAVASLLCGAVYYIVRLLCRRDTNLAPGSPRSFFATVCAVLLGVALTAFMLFPTADYIMQSPRVINSPIGKYYFVASLDRLFYMLSPRLADLFSPGLMSSDNCTVTTYIAGVGISGALIWLVNRPGHWASVLFIIFGVTYLTPLAGVFSLFTNPLYMRWGYALMMVIIVATLYVSSDSSIRVWPRFPLLYAGLVGVIGLLAVGATAYFYPFQLSNPASWITLGFSIACVGATLIVMRRHFSPGVLTAVCFIVASLNFILMDLLFVVKDLRTGGNFTEQYAGISALYKPLIDGSGLDVAPDPMTCRTDYYAASANYSILENRPSLTVYNSGVSGLTASFRQLISGSSVHQFDYLAVNRNSLSALLSVDKLIDTGYPSVHNPCPYRTLPDPGCDNMGRPVYHLSSYIPMGMAMDSFIPMSEFRAVFASSVSNSYGIPYVRMTHLNDSIDLCLQMLANAVVEDADTLAVAKWLRRGHLDLTLSLDSVCAERRKLTAKSFEGTRHGFRAEFDSPREAFYFLSVPADPGFKLKLDGQPVEPYRINLGMMGIVVPAGKHTLSASYVPPGLPAGICVSIIALIVWLTIWGLEYRRQ